MGKNVVQYVESIFMALRWIRREGGESTIIIQCMKLTIDFIGSMQLL